MGRKTTQEIFYEADINEQKLFKNELVGTGRLMQYITGTEARRQLSEYVGVKSDRQKRNYSTFSLTWPEEKYWLFCSFCILISGISCSVAIKIQLLVTAGTQMPFWIVRKVWQLFLQPGLCFSVWFSNSFLLHLIPVSSLWMKIQEIQNVIAIFCL